MMGRLRIGVVEAVGGLIIIEGSAVAIFSREVTIESLGTFEWYWVLLIGLLLIALGVALFFGSRRWSSSSGKDEKAFWLAILVGGAMIIIGILFAAFSSPVIIEGIGGIRGFWMALAGLQLMVLGLISFDLLLSSKYMKRNLGKLAPIYNIVACLVAIQGLGVLLLAAPVEVGTIGAGSLFVALAGAQLALLGVVLMLLPFIWNRRPGMKMLDYLGMGMSLLIALEGLVVLGLAAPTRLGDIEIGLGLMAFFGVQLAAIGSILMFVWAFSPMSRPRVQNIAFIVSIIILLFIPVTAVMTHL
jgi:hypothetical protein